MDLFDNLLFVEMDKEKLFIEEERLSDSKYKNATIMAKRLKFP